MTKKLGGLAFKERFDWIDLKASISEQALKGERSIDKTKRHDCEFISIILGDESSFFSAFRFISTCQNPAVKSMVEKKAVPLNLSSIASILGSRYMYLIVMVIVNTEA
ncbi:hypothetical protein G9A89_001967 [Geosiphon pyriformis]|nr:hypothetical protein G9A89_001967 [Geosiphon pyriformis]